MHNPHSSTIDPKRPAIKSEPQSPSHEDHGRSPVLFYLFGLIVYLIALLGSFSTVLTDIFFVVTMLASGYHVLAEGISKTVKESIARKRFHPNVHILMALAALGSSIIGAFDEGALLILIFAGAHFLEEYAEGKSKREITNLLQMNPTEARRILENGETELVSVSDLAIGDQLRVLPGDQVPTDGEIVSGSVYIDESAINGESMPCEKTVGDEVFGSTVNGDTPFTMTVTKDSEDTIFAKIITLVDQSQSNLSKTATTIKRIEPIYVVSVMIVVPIFILFMPFVSNWDYSESFYRGMIMLVSASPCALAASAVPATLSGISNLAKRGVLFKGGSYLSNLTKTKAVAFDKTGTLTQGKPVVTDTYFTDIEQTKKWKQLILAMEKQANHPLAKAIIEAFKAEGTSATTELTVQNEIGKGLTAHRHGKQYRIGKPSLFDQIPETIQDRTERLAKAGKTVVYFSENDLVVGLIAMMDLPNDNAASVIDYLKTQGIHTAMITGDAEQTGKAVADLLSIDEVVGNVLPENKSQIIKELQKSHGETVMVGDGINDAPALVQADIGFAMGDGTDIAIDVADAVIMQNDLTRFQYAHQLSEKLNRVVWQNIAFSMLVVVLLVTLNLLGQVDIGIGVLAHEGSTILVILNGLRLLLPLKIS
ncbi:heavy metal translocating P-type ATPase [Marinilactibacillus sp. Marseille-P9653]|uniref:heavy metal translocating P-type ATPase n=1 Tax=Marinilactibacillus sp. Marseille-P9653 TaxID=2866583 RepID=UPI001CE3BCD0|nr:heavy metal translocating P-type ATPase [Marinilactibacillus sp. Marseille-P9653]